MSIKRSQTQKCNLVSNKPSYSSDDESCRRLVLNSGVQSDGWRGKAGTLPASDARGETQKKVNPSLNLEIL